MMKKFMRNIMKYWEVIKNFLKIDFTVNPIRVDIYLVAKLKIFNKVNKTAFTNNAIPLEKNNYICIPAIDIDSVLKLIKYYIPKLI